MILLYIFILIFICPIRPQTFTDKNGFPSFRSSVIKDGKPILRGGGPEPEEDVEPSENNTSDDGKTIYDALPKEAEDIDQTEIASTHNNNIDERNSAEIKKQHLLEDISVLIEWLVEKYGYKLAVKYRRDEGVTGEDLFSMRARHKKRKNKKKQSKKHKGSKGRKKDKRTSNNNNNSDTNHLYDASSERNSNEHENTAKTNTKKPKTNYILPESSSTKTLLPENLNAENIITRTGDNIFDKRNEDDHSSKDDNHNKGLNVEIKPIEMDLTDIVKMIRSNMPNIVYGGQQNSDPPSVLTELGKKMPNVSIAFSVQI